LSLSDNALLLPLLQKHYDFGMRALKAVLVMAGSLKRRSPSVPEEMVLIQAMRDANLPKLLSEVRLQQQQQQQQQ
jgi:hypothetical protein